MQLSQRTLFRFCLGKFKNPEQKFRFQQKIKFDRVRQLDKISTNYSQLNQTHTENFKEYKHDPVYLDRCEVETRILKRLYKSELVDLRKFSFGQDLRTDLKLDSLNIVVILTEIEHEFTTVFEDRVFQSCRNLKELVDILERDEKVF